MRSILYDLIYKVNYTIKNFKIIYPIHKIFKFFWFTSPYFLRKRLSTIWTIKKPVKIISDKFKFIYIENPLTASRSMFRLFIRNPKLKFNAFTSEKRLEILIRKNKAYRNYLKFSIVRNPWSRLVSCYNKKILNANNIGKIAILSQYKGLSPLMSFEEFVKWLCSKEGSDKFADLHWVSQYKILYNKEQIPKYDFLLRLENLKEDFNTLMEKLHISQVNLPHKASSRDMLFGPLFSSWKDYYTQLDGKTLENIENRYKKDAKILGYPKLRKIL